MMDDNRFDDLNDFVLCPQCRSVISLLLDYKRLRDALKEIMRSPKCNNPSCTIDNPLCNTMIAVAALKGGDK